MSKSGPQASSSRDAVLPGMRDKDADIRGVAERALGDDGLLSELLQGLKSRVSTKSGEETLRYNCHKALALVSELRGRVLYQRWADLVELLDSENSYHRMSAVALLAGLASVDCADRFDEVFDRYWGLLDDRSVIVAIYVASNSGRIALAKPQLAGRITEKLLSIDETHHPAGRKELVKAGAIEAFSSYYGQAGAGDRRRILEFVGAQQSSPSPKTRKLAREFLKNRTASCL